MVQTNMPRCAPHTSSSHLQWRLGGKAWLLSSLRRLAGTSALSMKTL